MTLVNPILIWWFTFFSCFRGVGGATQWSMTKKDEPELFEILQITISVAKQLDELETQFQAAKITIEDVNTKLKYRCMSEDLKHLKK